MTALLVAAVIGFLLGSIPFSYLLAKSVGGLDIRAVGSGNVGATNVARFAGWRLGVVALLLDAAKGAAAACAGRALGSGPEALAAGAVAGGMAILGHVFTPWLGFRGGKGVATGAGVFAVLHPAAVGIALAAFASAVALSRMVSLGSVAAATMLPIAALGLGAPRPVVVLAFGAGTLILWTHRGNIARMWNRSEHRIGPGGTA
jgi:glycerol-3-phosphate acyltransferase PlsY